MSKKYAHIKDVIPGSVAEELGIEKGDLLVSINGASVRDILEYKFLVADEFVEIEIEKASGDAAGQQWILEVEKEYDEDLGIVFDGIIDEPKSCHNKCIFCFIDQMPKGMRDTLYFKDDDTRLSFLQGNFVTLTNLKEADITRIIRYRISPINVSVHTTNPDLRIKMLNNKNAGKLMTYLGKLKENNIEIKAQVVLCRGVNDGDELSSTIADLSVLYPELSCVAVVPVGLTKYRDGLFEMQSHDVQSARDTVLQVERLQQQYLEKLGTRFVFLSDEFYILAGMELPGYEVYEGFSQLENGVGLITLFRDEIDRSLEKIDEYEPKKRNITIVTGEYAAPYIKAEAAKIISAVEGLQIDVVAIRNDFFGHDVKVAGLITGRDIISQLKGKSINDALYIPDSMLKSGERIFLDDLTVEDIEKELGVKIIVCAEDGSNLVQNILKA